MMPFQKMLYSEIPKEIGRPREMWRKSVNKELGRVGKIWYEAQRIATKRMKWNTLIAALCSK